MKLIEIQRIQCQTTVFILATLIISSLVEVRIVLWLFEKILKTNKTNIQS